MRHDEVKEVSPFSYPPALALFYNIFSKSFTRAYYLSEVADSSVSACEVIFELEEYKVEEGGYPASISELIDAGYEVELPDDIDGEGKIKYLNDGSRSVLYGVGENGKDDGGYYDGKEDEGDRDDRIYWERDEKS